MWLDAPMRETNPLAHWGIQLVSFSPSSPTVRFVFGWWDTSSASTCNESIIDSVISPRKLSCLHLDVAALCEHLHF
jgi:hypothetical protein